MRCGCVVGVDRGVGKILCRIAKKSEVNSFLFGQNDNEASTIQPIGIGRLVFRNEKVNIRNNTDQNN